MNTFRCVALSIICLLWSSTVQAQQRHGTGLVYNADQYKKSVKTQKLDGVSGTKMNTLPLVMNLNPYCPTPQNQGEEPSCSAWATAYGAMTIHHAIKNNVTNPREVDKIAHSKTFVFNQVCTEESCYVQIEEMFKLLTTQGTCLAATFRNDVPMAQKPDLVAIKEATRFKLDGYAEAFDPDKSIKIDKHILRFKRLLADSTPIIIGMNVPESFKNLDKYTDKDKWRLKATDIIDPNEAHALCVVGYNDFDSTFQVMNSWGVEWGSEGFAKIHYTDLFRLLMCAYTLKPHFTPTTERVEMILRKPINLDNQFEEVRVSYDSKTNDYKTVQKSWREGANFQLVLRSVPVNWFIYAFGVNPTGEVSVFHESMVEKNKVEKIIPSEAQQLAIESGGTEYMCVLLSKYPLPNFNENIKKIKQPTTIGFYEQVKTVFSDVLLSNPPMMTERMGFVYPKDTDKAIALILSIN